MSPRHRPGRRRRTAGPAAPSSVALLILLPALAAALAACGGGEGGRQTPDEDAGTDAAARRPAPFEELAAGDLPLDGWTVRDTTHEDPADPDRSAAGGPSIYPEAGCSIRWPAGCGRIGRKVSDGATDRAAREFIFAADCRQAEGWRANLHVLRDAHTAQGDPPHPRFVVAIIEERIRDLGARIQRQRPLSDAALQGVEVQAVQRGGEGELWIRGFLAGTDVFVLMVWSPAGGVLRSEAAREFLDSLQLG